MVGERGQFHVRASKGIHLVVPKDRIQSSTGLILRTEKTRAVRHPVGPALDHRHHRHRLGPGQGPPGRDRVGHRLPPRARQRGAHHAADRARTSRACTPGCGRCCPASRSRTSKLSREHVVAHAAPGLVVVAGGKYTTYRVMAKDAVDAAAHGPGRQGAGVASPTDVPLVGAEGYARAVEPAAPDRAALRPARGPDRAPAEPVRRADRRGPRAGRGGPDARRAAARRARTTCGPRSCTRANAEGARHLDDVLARRTRISIEAWDRGVGARRGRGRS